MPRVHRPAPRAEATGHAVYGEEATRLIEERKAAQRAARSMGVAGLSGPWPRGHRSDEAMISEAEYKREHPEPEQEYFGPGNEESWP